PSCKNIYLLTDSTIPDRDVVHLFHSCFPLSTSDFSNASAPCPAASSLLTAGTFAPVTEGTGQSTRRARRHRALRAGSGRVGGEARDAPWLRGRTSRSLTSGSEG